MQKVINKILFITLSNIGDVILTLPVLNSLIAEYPDSQVSVIVGERSAEIFENNPAVSKVIVYDKYKTWRDHRKLYYELKREKFDLVVDLRNTAYGLLLVGNLPFINIPKSIRHMRDRHIFKVKSLKLKVKSEDIKSLNIPTEDEKYINAILKENNVSANDKLIIISSGARSHIKRWPRENFVELCKGLARDSGIKIILVGDKGDLPTLDFIAENCRGAINLGAKTNIRQLAALLQKASILITNDSAVLHLASYLGTKVLAIFGPTNEEKYGPWSMGSRVVRRHIFCAPCEKAQCRFGTLECMRLVKVEDVIQEVKKMLSSDKKNELSAMSYEPSDFKRILIIRTDRIGDVLLSTPAIKALREAYPNAYIAMMVSPQAKDIVEGNPYLDAVIIYDKGGKHKSAWRTIKFARNLKKKKFDLAVILHPTNRVHLISFLAGIPKRVGFKRKLGFLLTDKIEHKKQLGEKHELEYTLDVLRYLGIEGRDKSAFMPLRREAEEWAEETLRKYGLGAQERLIAIHPLASCPSKIWPGMRFSEVANNLIKKYHARIVVISGQKDINIARDVARNIEGKVIDLSGQTSVAQLASLLKRCSLFISNDSGPVHIASAVGTPVISIFGRSQKGLSPKRWGPIGKKDRVLHKEVGCIACLAHNCVKEFACLKAITVDDVMQAVEQALNL